MPKPNRAAVAGSGTLFSVPTTLTLSKREKNGSLREPNFNSVEVEVAIKSVNSKCVQVGTATFDKEYSSIPLSHASK